MDKYSNRLAKESSPYLLQHSRNPVDWYPWCEEAFEKARIEDKPVFLSIGYSTCHWCHVMEQESFEDQKTADLMNRVFVSIKVDREERPDIDNIYMMACQMMTGSGGWPLSIIMTPGKKPFYAGTYFPRESRFGRIGFNDLINKIDEAWHSKRDGIDKSSLELTRHLADAYSSKPAIEIDASILENAFTDFEERFDPVNGGFGTAPKFPSPHNLMFLLRYWKRSGNQEALNIALKTLTGMRRGGIFDQAGFGFHRYSTDSKWLVPHFEKMLYDQALLIMAYTEAFQATGEKEFSKTACETVTYILRDMTSPAGGFYSAEDADSEGVEGKFYLWAREEIVNILGPEDAALICDLFKVSEKGNFQEETGHSSNGGNILHLTDSEIDLNKGKIIEDCLTKLFEQREKRVHPYKDDKILTDWNGLMIAALAKAGRVFRNGKYIAAAEKALGFINNNLTKPDGRLNHRFRNESSGIEANLDDYAFLVQANLELYESTFKAVYITEAIQATETAIKHFWDEKSGGFFFTPDYGEKLIARTKEYYDGAVPSGNSVFAHNMIKLARITGEIRYEEYAVKIFESASIMLSKNPQAFTHLLSALDYSYGPGYEIIVAGDIKNDATEKMLREISSWFIPNKVLLLKDENNPDYDPPFEYLKSYSSETGAPVIFVCKNFVCSMPATEIEDVIRLLA